MIDWLEARDGYSAPYGSNNILADLLPPCHFPALMSYLLNFLFSVNVLTCSEYTRCLSLHTPLHSIFYTHQCMLLVEAMNVKSSWFGAGQAGYLVTTNVKFLESCWSCTHPGKWVICLHIPVLCLGDGIRMWVTHCGIPSLSPTLLTMVVILQVHLNFWSVVLPNTLLVEDSIILLPLTIKGRWFDYLV